MRPDKRTFVRIERHTENTLKTVRKIDGKIDRDTFANGRTRADTADQNLPIEKFL